MYAPIEGVRRDADKSGYRSGTTKGPRSPRPPGVRRMELGPEGLSVTSIDQPIGLISFSEDDGTPGWIEGERVKSRQKVEG